MYTSDMKKTFLVIDGHALVFKAYYAFPPTLTWNNHPIHAAFGFISLFFKVYDLYKPDYLTVCFDRKEPTFRHDMFSGYKAHRPPAPEDLIFQVDLLKSILSEMKIPLLEKPGFEADDLMGTLSKMATAQQVSTLLFTGDHDSLQLVDDFVHVVMNKKSDIIECDEKKIQEMYQLSPQQIVDFKALKGDTSDNIPGVAGIGDKTAIKLLSEYKTLESIYENIQTVQPKGVQDKLINGKDSALLSQKLATIFCEVPLEQTLDTFFFTPDWAVILAQFNTYNFKSLYQKYQKIAEPQQTSFFSESSPSIEISSAVFITEKDFLARFSSHSLDLGVEYTEASLEIAISEDQVYTLTDTTSAIFEFLFTRSDVIVTFDARSLYYHWIDLGYAPKPVKLETGLALFLIDPIATQSKEGVLAYFNINQSYSTGHNLHLYQRIHNELDARHVLALYTYIEAPLAVVLAKMEKTGVTLDLAYMDNIKQIFEERLAVLIKKCQAFSSQPFNLNSPKQLADVLFDELGLPVIKHTKTGRSTDSSVLEKLKSHHEIAALLLDYRSLEKLVSTYVNTLPQLVNKKTQRIHTYFNQKIASTGRLSSVNPNLQNIPVRSEEGLLIREAFIPSASDRVLVSADYSQIELRILAHLSQDPHLIEAFRQKRDIHKSTAALIFSVPLDEVTKEQRYKAKAVNFGILYGISPFGLSEQLGISPAEAKTIITHYFDQFPTINQFIKTTIDYAKEHGHVVTEFGRVRPIAELKSPQFAVRQFGERAAVNTRIQGTAADIIKMAMISIDNSFAELGFQSKMVLQVHDELVFDVMISEKERLCAEVKRIMENVADWQVPLDVDLSEGKNWKEISI